MFVNVRSYICLPLQDLHVGTIQLNLSLIWFQSVNYCLTSKYKPLAQIIFEKYTTDPRNIKIVHTIQILNEKSSHSHWHSTFSSSSPDIYKGVIILPQIKALWKVHKSNSVASYNELYVKTQQYLRRFWETACKQAVTISQFLCTLCKSLSFCFRRRSNLDDWTHIL